MKNIFNKINKILFLGPNGSYSEIAKNKFENYFGLDCTSEYCVSITNLLNQISQSSENILGVLPIENSIEGTVRETLDKLPDLAALGYRIIAETTVDIAHCLIGFTDEKKEIKEVLSHPQALAQCREYISKNFADDIQLTPTLSTSLAVSKLNQENKHQVAIGNSYCAEIYNTPVIDTNINDENNNTTRFILLGKSEPYQTDNSKVCIYFSTLNKPGALNKVLSVIEKYGLNMSQINSRPSRKVLGEYVFYVDLCGHIANENVKKAINEILPLVNKFELLSNGAIVV